MKTSYWSCFWFNRRSSITKPYVVNILHMRGILVFLCILACSYTLSVACNLQLSEGEQSTRLPMCSLTDPAPLDGVTENRLLGSCLSPDDDCLVGCTLRMFQKGSMWGGMTSYDFCFLANSSSLDLLILLLLLILILFLLSLRNPFQLQ